MLCKIFEPAFLRFEGESVNTRIWSATVACISIIPLSLALNGCTDTLDLEIHPDDSPQVLSEVWGIEIPPTMVTEEFYHSDVGFTGDGDFIRVLKLPEVDQVGEWDPDSFQEPLDKGRASVVIDASKASLRVEDLDGLKCRPPLNKEGGDFLMLCHDKASDIFYSFESTF